MSAKRERCWNDVVQMSYKCFLFNMFKWNTLSLCAGVNFNVVFKDKLKKLLFIIMNNCSFNVISVSRGLMRVTSWPR